MATGDAIVPCLLDIATFGKRQCLGSTSLVKLSISLQCDDWVPKREVAAEAFLAVLLLSASALGFVSGNKGIDPLQRQMTHHILVFVDHCCLLLVSCLSRCNSSHLLRRCASRTTLLKAAKHSRSEC